MVNRCYMAASCRGNINQYLMPVLRCFGPRNRVPESEQRWNSAATGEFRAAGDSGGAIPELRLLREALGVKIAAGPFVTRLGDATGDEEFLDLMIIFDEGVFLGS
jgi:hypothetical protein